MSKRLKILWAVESQWAATTRYRVVIPARPMRKQGHQIDVQETVDKRQLDKFPYDLVCMQRNAGANVGPFMKALQNLGVPIVYDMDDDVFNIEPSSPVFDLYNKAPHIPMIQQQAMRFANGLTVSTEQLQKVYWGINENCRVVPNRVDIWDWMPEKFPRLSFGDGNIMMVWEGSNTHADSLALVLPTIQRLMTLYSNLGMVFIGLDRLPTMTLPRDRTFCFGWGSYTNLQSLLTACHIGLAPLNGSKFNRSKSNLRIMEYACAGLAVIGSPHGEYESAIANAGGVLCKNEGEWEEGLRKLIEDEHARRAAAFCAKEWVLDFDVNRYPDAWLNVWSELTGV